MNTPISEVYNEDCMIGMARYPEKFFDLAIVDPPYGIGNWIQITGKLNKIHSKVNWNEKDNRPNDYYFNELRRISKNRIVFGANYYPYAFEKENGAIIWDKGIARETNYSVCEIASQSFNKRVDCVRIRWNAAIDKKFDDKIHECSKPIQLYKWLLRNYAKPGDKILDTHLGSQSSRIAAWDGGFDFYGWELDEDYFRDGCKRFDNHIKQLNLF